MIPDVFKTLPDDIPGRRALTFSEHLRKHAKRSGRMPIEAGVISRVMSKNIRNSLNSNPTAGLANKVLHGKKVNHTIQNIMKKTAHLFKRVLR